MDKNWKNDKSHKAMALQIIEELPEEKKRVLINCLNRNNALTSSYVMEHGELHHTPHGFYLQLQGTRCNFSVYMTNDYEIKRKPRDEVSLRSVYLNFNESDFYNLR